MDWFLKVYAWELFFEGGKKVSQLEEDKSMEEMIDKYGTPLSLALIPRRAGLKVVRCPIPEKTTPVYFRRVTKDWLQRVRSAKFAIGYKLPHTQVVVMADSVTGDIIGPIAESIKG